MLYSDDDYARRQREEEEWNVGRSAFRRDYGRLLHSPSFRRLQGKTQLFPGHESDFFRNRLTHSLEVAQIAKGIAQQINAVHKLAPPEAIDLDLVEFAGLAHDLGHPPFGHNGEHALDDCMKNHGGFEGNAQTLRILSAVEKKVVRSSSEADGPCGIDINGADRRLGLNLTYRSLAAILKYDNPIPLKRSKRASLEKGYYASERDLVCEIKARVGDGTQGKFKTIECQIMDIADDIAYSTYDLEDAMKGGFTHPLKLLADVANRPLFEKLCKKVKKEVPDVSQEEVFTAVTDLLVLNGQRGDKDDTAKLVEAYVESMLIANDGRMRVGFSSTLVGKFMSGVSVDADSVSNLRFAELKVARDIRIKIESLKHLNFLLTIMSPRLKVVEYRGYEVVKTIFETLDSEEGHLLLPDDLRQMYERLQGTDEKKRLICDFVAGMTDRYAVEFYSRLRESGASIFKPL